MRISVVVPVYNEEGNLPELHRRLLVTLATIGAEPEIVYVNDGSRDGSIACIRQLAASDSHVKYIDLSRNFGHQVAVTAGLRAATGNRVVIIDSDLQDPPELIAELNLAMDTHGLDVVYARRRARAGESAFKRLTAKLFYRVLQRLTPIDIPVDTGDFRIMSRRVVDVLNRMPEQHRFIRGQVAWAGFPQGHVEYDRHGRNAGESGYPLSKMLRFAMDGITSFSDFPLRLSTMLGFTVSGISFVLMLYALYSRLVLKVYEPGWASIMLSVLFIGGIQLVCVGIIGEYIGRISDNVKGRPLYVVRETNIASSEAVQ
jgi:dolichol-phosphate mannosyltransferase